MRGDASGRNLYRKLALHRGDLRDYNAINGDSCGADQRM